MPNSMLPSRRTANSSRDGRKIQGNTPSGLVGPEAPASNSIASLRIAKAQMSSLFSECIAAAPAQLPGLW